MGDSGRSDEDLDPNNDPRRNDELDWWLGAGVSDIDDDGKDKDEDEEDLEKRDRIEEN